MRKIIFGFLFGFLMSISIVFADNITAPPPIKDSNILHYFQQIYENLHRLQVVTSNPDGTRNGKKGDIILLQTGGTSYLEINTDSLTTWRGIALSDTP